MSGVAKPTSEQVAACPVMRFDAGHYWADGSCKCRPRPDADRNLSAEARAVEEGHRAFVVVDPHGTWIRVKSNTIEGKWYRVTFEDTGQGIRFECEPEGEKAFQQDHLSKSARPGVAPCKHAALAARRLEREGLAVLDAAGLWRTTTPKDPVVSRVPADPFEGLPR